MPPIPPIPDFLLRYVGVPQLCPNCLCNVFSFPMTGTDSDRSYSCPECDKAVPVMYVEDYRQFGPVVFSIMGHSGHGKTVYLDSLLHHFESLAAQVIDGGDLQVVQRKLQAKRQGNKPGASSKVFSKPLIIRLEDAPSRLKCDLLMFDQGGETFDRIDEIKSFAPYLFRSRALVWLVSLVDLEDRDDLANLLSRYVLAIREKGGKPKDQHLIIVLTKGDELVDHPGLPESARNFLNGEDDALTSRSMEQLSNDLELWLEREEGHQQLVRNARNTFKEVRYCIVSALGSAPSPSGKFIAATPCGIMVPLMWAVRASRGGPVTPPTNSRVGLNGWRLASRYKDVLNHPDMVAYCKQQARENERQKALRDLAAGQVEAAAQLISAFDADASST